MHWALVFRVRFILSWCCRNKLLKNHRKFVWYYNIKKFTTSDSSWLFDQNYLPLWDKIMYSSQGVRDRSARIVTNRLIHIKLGCQKLAPTWRWFYLGVSWSPSGRRLCERKEVEICVVVCTDLFGVSGGSRCRLAPVQIWYCPGGCGVNLGDFSRAMATNLSTFVLHKTILWL